MSVERATMRLPGRLAGLKRRGGGVLVVGTDGHEALCRRFGGDRSSSRRVLTVPAAGPACATECTHPPEGAASVEGCGWGTRRLSEVGSETIDRIDRLAAEGLDGSELRVCIESADALVDSADPERATLFVDAVLERTREAGGIAHVHTTEPYRSDPVRRFGPLFDAVVEVRADPHPRQRWHLPDSDHDTGWLPLRD